MQNITNYYRNRKLIFIEKFVRGKYIILVVFCVSEM